MTIKKYLHNPWTHVIFLVVLLSLVFSQTSIFPKDDYGYYNQFIITFIDQGRIDLSIPGFHGPGFFASFIYLLTGSELSIIFFEILITLLTIPLIYLTVKEIYKNKLKGVLAAYTYVLLPLIIFTPFRGWTWTSTLFFSLLTIYLLSKNSKLAWLAFGIGIITKPFVFTVFPFFIYRKQIKQFFAGLVIPAIYLLVSYLQAGRIIIGVHPDWQAQDFFNLKNIVSNLFITFQSYFSLHNFTPLHVTYNTDMIHFSAFFSFLAVLGIFFWQKYFSDKKLFYTLVAFMAASYLLPLLFSYYDRYYFTIFDLSVIIFAISVLPHYKAIIPLITFSFIYQFFYTYLGYENIFWQSGNYVIFIIPILILIISIIYSWFPKLYQLNNHQNE